MEIWDGYNRDESLANVDLIRGEKIPDGLYHLACEALIRHQDGDFLLMKRDTKKAMYGGYFEATSGGAALKGENSLMCVKREVFEETGIDVNHFEEIAHNISDENHYIFYSFTCTVDCDKDSIKLQKGETIGYKWISEKEFIDFVNSDKMIDTQKNRYLNYLTKLGYIK